MILQFKAPPPDMALEVSQLLERFLPIDPPSGEVSKFYGALHKPLFYRGERDSAFDKLRREVLSLRKEVLSLRKKVQRDIREFQDIVSQYEEEISKIPEVQGVVRTENAKKILFITMISDTTKALSHEVYVIQQRLERKHPHWLLEFHYIEPEDLHYIEPDELSDEIEVEASSL